MNTTEATREQIESEMLYGHPGAYPPDELEFGDYTDGRFAWRLTNVRKLKRPMPYKGALGLRILPREIETEVMERANE